MEKNWKLHHIAVIVRDIDKAVQYYQSLGIATVGREVIFPESKPKIRAKFVEVGSIPIEFIQPLEGESSRYKEFLDSKGEGVQHIAFAVDNLDGEADKLVDKGASIIVKGKAPAAFGSISAHFDTRQVGDFAIQLIQEAE
ncbi:MAG: VOC family protein [Chloroflexi bacterium]|nr:VOC family protein [Chloroflexota bacterium]